MSLTDDINNLPGSPREIMPGHLHHHATIHSALRNHNSHLTTIDTALEDHNSHLTTIDEELDTVETELSQRIDGKADSVHRHVSADISDAVAIISDTPNRVVKTNSTGKLAITTDFITEQRDPTNKAYVDAADTALGERIDLLYPKSIRTGQVLKWDGTKYIPSWMDQHTNLYDNTY